MQYELIATGTNMNGTDLKNLHKNAKGMIIEKVGIENLFEIFPTKYSSSDSIIIIKIVKINRTNCNESKMALMKNFL